MSSKGQSLMIRTGTAIFRVTLGASLIVALSGCGPLISLGGDSKPPTLYSLTPPRPADDAEKRAPLDATLVISEPAASDAIDSRRIALKPSDLEVRYYSGVRWTDRAPRLMQTLLVSSFSGTVTTAAADTMPVTPTYRLTSRLIAFEARYPRPKAPVATVEMELQLYSTRPLSLVATTRITSEKAAASDRSAAISGAFNAAAQDVASQAVTWAREAMAENAATAPNAAAAKP